jgi:putative ABC transport system permease protein
VDTTIRDVRLALRSLWRTPSVALVALISLVVGIGVNSTAFSLVNAALFPVLPYERPERILDLYEMSADLCAGCAVGTSYATFLDWREQATVFERMGASREDGFVLAGGNEPERISGAVISADLFPTLGVQPVLGRSFTAEEDRPGATGTVLLGHGIWQRRFGSDSAIVGRVLRLNGRPVTVVGVMPPRFRYPERADVWTPIAPTAPDMGRSDRSVTVVARLRSGATLGQARAEMEAIGRRLATRDPAAFRGWRAGATTLMASLTGDADGIPFIVLFGAATFVLLIACANVANLMLARATSRWREYAVRVALGASRMRLARHVLTECLLIALAGGAAAFVVAVWAVEAVPGALGTEIPFWIDFRVNARVLAFTGVVAVLTGLIFGLAPALRAARTDVRAALADNARSATTGRRRGRLRGALVVGELALAVVLLTGALLMIKGFLQQQNVATLGYDPRQILTGSIDLLDARYDEPRQRGAMYAALDERLRAIPGVEGVSPEHSDFLGTFVGREGQVTLEGAASAVPDDIVPRFAHSVGPDYFTMLRIPVVRGRGFTSGDRAGAPGVVIVNEAAARALWPNIDPLGRRLKLGRPGDDRPWLTVVGVVGSVIGSPIGRRITPLVYAPYAQRESRSFTLFVRTSADPLAMAPAIRAALAAVDPDLPISDVMTREAALAGWVGPSRFFAWVLGALALFAVLLAMSGVYSVTAYAMAQRTQEVGIRVALGASPAAVMRMLLRQGLTASLLGIVLGLAGSLSVTGVLRGLVPGLRPADPVVLPLVAVLLTLVATAATYVPARRALAVDPVIALRTE